MTTVEYMTTRETSHLAKSIKKIVKLYARGGVTVNLCLMDMEFDKIKDLVGFLEVNTTAAREHVGDVERQIRLIKERTRCVTTDLPFDPIPKMVLIHMIYSVCFWLNAFPIKSGTA